MQNIRIFPRHLLAFINEKMRRDTEPSARSSDFSRDNQIGYKNEATQNGKVINVLHILTSYNCFQSSHRQFSIHTSGAAPKQPLQTRPEVSVLGRPAVGPAASEGQVIILHPVTQIILYPGARPSCARYHQSWSRGSSTRRSDQNSPNLHDA